MSWQPMETALANGRKIIVGRWEDVERGCPFWLQTMVFPLASSRDGTGPLRFLTECGYDLNWEPEAWTELPEPPA